MVAPVTTPTETASAVQVRTHQLSVKRGLSTPVCSDFTPPHPSSSHRALQAAAALSFTVSSSVCPDPAMWDNLSGFSCSMNPPKSLLNSHHPWVRTLYTSAVGDIHLLTEFFYFYLKEINREMSIILGQLWAECLSRKYLSSTFFKIFVFYLFKRFKVF